MKKEEKIELSEAIKQYYRTEPLKINLPVVVANRIFKKGSSAASDHWLYYLVLLCCLAMMTMCVWALAPYFSSPLLIGVVVSFTLFLGLAYKEVSRWQDRVQLHLRR